MWESNHRPFPRAWSMKFTGVLHWSHAKWLISFYKAKLGNHHGFRILYTEKFPIGNWKAYHILRPFTCTASPAAQRQLRPFTCLVPQTSKLTTNNQWVYIYIVPIIIHDRFVSEKNTFLSKNKFFLDVIKL